MLLICYSSIYTQRDAAHDVPLYFTTPTATQLTTDMRIAGDQQAAAAGADAGGPPVRPHAMPRGALGHRYAGLAAK